MRKRYKIVLNLEIDDPDAPFPAGGDYTHLNRLQGLIHGLMYTVGVSYTVTLDKVIDKGEVRQKEKNK